jgi:tRNA(Arg) A34 adenosine deaminase TadA
MTRNRVKITLPAWATSREFYTREYKTDEDRIALAIEIADRNVKSNTGGPFGTCIFEKNLDTGEYKLISVGMNRVVPLGNSTLHGETVAIQMAQRKLKTYSLFSEDSNKSYELYTSCEPCCMCLGATLWSGVSRLVCAAAKADALAIGFDEGPVYEESYEYLVRAGIEVKRGLLQKEGAKVLQNYAKAGEIYNR